MTDVQAPTVDRISELERRLALLDERIAILERKAQTVAAARAVVAPAGGKKEQTEGAPVPEPLFDLALAGRILIIIGGAYLLRAITQADVIPALAGILLALLYAAFWLLNAARTAALHPSRSLAEGAIALLISIAIAWEGVARLDLLGRQSAAAIIVAFVLGALIVAWRGNLHLLAWFAGGMSALGLGAIAAASSDPLIAAAALTVAAAGTTWLAIRKEWSYIDIVPWAGADFLLLLSFVVSRRSGEWRMLTASILLAAVVIFFGFIAAKLLVLRRDISLFDVIQSGVILVISGGSIYSLAGKNLPLRAFAGAALIAIAASIYRASARHASRDAVQLSRYYCGVGAVAVAIVGSALMLGLTAASVLWSVAALAHLWLAPRRRGELFSLRSVLYLVAASAASGLVSFALAGTFVPFWPTRPSFVVLFVAASWCVAALMRLEQGDIVDRTVRVSIAVAAVGSLALIAFSPLQQIIRNEAALVLSRTLIVVVIALALMLVARRHLHPDAAFLSYLFLAGGALKLIAEDLRFGTATTLFVTLATYGAALLIISRLKTQLHRPETTT